MTFTAVFAFVVLSVLGLAVALAVVYLAAWLGRSVRRGVASLPRGMKSLLVEPPAGAAFNDSLDVWPMPE
ncbi:hypothetical protein ACH4OY_07355 [Micromonospora rubida]|uniref:Uncharacterized protein n=1 Tax=Micromonospora rubida TaxID=2697657 RepID=A0ABW7SFN0_9ACTN